MFAISFVQFLSLLMILLFGKRTVGIMGSTGTDLWIIGVRVPSSLVKVAQSVSPFRCLRVESRYDFVTLPLRTSDFITWVKLATAI